MTVRDALNIAMEEVSPFTLAFARARLQSLTTGPIRALSSCLSSDADTRAMGFSSWDCVGDDPRREGLHHRRGGRSIQRCLQGASACSFACLPPLPSFPRAFPHSFRFPRIELPPPLPPFLTPCDACSFRFIPSPSVLISLILT